MIKNLSHVDLTEKILGCAITVHKELGPGFLEKIYEHALCIEFDHHGISYHRQKPMPITYRKKQCGFHQFDLVVENKIIIELKATSGFDDIHFATVFSYLKASSLPVALLLNYAKPILAIRRFGNSFIKTGNPGTQENLGKANFSNPALWK